MPSYRNFGMPPGCRRRRPVCCCPSRHWRIRQAVSRACVSAAQRCRHRLRLGRHARDHASAFAPRRTHRRESLFRAGLFRPRCRHRHTHGEIDCRCDRRRGRKIRGLRKPQGAGNPRRIVASPSALNLGNDVVRAARSIALNFKARACKYHCVVNVTKGGDPMSSEIMVLSRGLGHDSRTLEHPLVSV